MNPLIENLNLWRERFLNLAWPLLWQSSLLIVVLLLLDLTLRRKVRAAVRYALWLVVLVKLVLPPTLAFPTSLAWWLQPRHAPPAKPQPIFVVTYGNSTATELPPVVETAYTPPPLRLSRDGWTLVAWATVSIVLLGWMGARWRQIARDIRRATPAPPWLDELLTAAREQAGLRRRVELRLTARPMSPAVCGLIRPVILLPRSLVEQLPPAQLRAVLLHELVHLRRGDVWVNCAQALLQIVYWWHPLLWLANARIRRAREEAVDDAVMLALRDEAEHYAPTLLEVAKLAFNRPLASLALVGILESRSALRQRIERLVTFHPPRKAELTIASVLGVLFFAMVALPMEKAPALPEPRDSTPTGPAARIQAVSEGETDALAQAVTPPAPSPTHPGKTNFLVTRGGIIGEKLWHMRLESVHYDRMPLEDVLRVLEREVNQRDAEKMGIRFAASESSESPSAAGNQGANPALSTNVDLRSILITINTPLTDVRVHDVLEAIVKAAGVPIHYSFTDEGVWFLPGEQLFTRFFKLDPNTFSAAVRKRVGSSETNTIDEFSAALRKLFANIGVDFHPPKSVFYNDLQGKLITRASQSDMDRIQNLLAELNSTPPQINIEARFFETTPAETKGIGLDWYLGNLVRTNVADSKISGPDPGQFHGILTPSQFVTVLSALEQRGMIQTLAVSKVATLSGRQAQIQSVYKKSVVTGIKLQAQMPPGIISGGGGTNSIYESEALAFGPVLDVTPAIAADSYTINMTLIPTVTEFLGYDETTNLVPAYVNGQRTNVAVPLPRFRVRQMTVNAVVRDGQTLVLANPRVIEISKKPDGRTEANEVSGKDLKELIVFVTPTITDPAGNPIHSDGDMPFARKGVPPQPSR